VARRAARGGVPEAVAHRAEPADRAIEFVGLGGKLRTVDARAPVGCEHGADLIEREPGRPAKRDQRQMLQHGGVEQPAQSPPARGRDQPPVFVVSQRRGRQPRAPGHFGNVETGDARTRHGS